MKTKLTQYRESIAKMRYYLAQLSGGGSGGESDWTESAAAEIHKRLKVYCADTPAIIRRHAPDQSAQLKYAALLTYELNRLPYQPPRPRKSFLTRILNRIQK